MATRFHLAVLLLPPLLASPASADEALGGPGLYLFRTGSEIQLARGAELLRLEVPSEVALQQLAPLGRGAVLAGVRRSGAASELYLAEVAGETLRELPVGDLGRARLRAEPVPVVRGDALAGLAWLEGDAPDRLAVRCAERSGSGWSATREVSPPGPGSQVALAAAPLADGSLLLVWSRFDGHDDEIVFSVGRKGTWSAPQPIDADNAVPDVTPALFAEGRGALAVWSRYDGHEYRLVVARYDGERWAAPHGIGEAGSLFPSFVAGAGDSPRLLYRDARAEGWVVADLGPSGEIVRRSQPSVARRQRPLVFAGEDGAPFLRWRDAEERAPWRP